MKRLVNENCVACYAKDCDCECDTCLAARERNRLTDSKELHLMNIENAMSKLIEFNKD